MRSTRGWWIVLGGFIVVFLENVCLVVLIEDADWPRAVPSSFNSQFIKAIEFNDVLIGRTDQEANFTSVIFDSRNCDLLADKAIVALIKNKTELNFEILDVGAENESPQPEVEGSAVTEVQIKSQQQQHLCCARHEKMIDVGYGMSDQVIQVDAGHCKRLCPRHAIDDPGDASRPAVQRCPVDWHCRPNSARLERISTLQGVRVIEAVDSCDCTPKQSCSREPYTYVVYPGTPHQADIDVGLCTGHCTQGIGCKPLRNRTISIVGPNGDEVHQVIEECGCSGDCYRMTHVETVLDFSEVEIKDGSNSTEVKPLARAIDVGQCVGACTGKEMETCLLRDKKDPSRCLAGLYSKQNSCTPARFKIHEYRSRRGAMREIIAITQCACV